MTKKRKPLASLLALFLVLQFLIPASQAGADSNPAALEKLAPLSGEAQLEVLLNNGLQLPDGLKKDAYTASAVNTIVADIQRGVTSADRIPYNYTELAELAKRVLAVSEKSAAVTASYTLKDSTVLGSWSDSYLNYNCYGYAIGVQVFQNPGYHSNQSFSMSLPIASMADLVVSDLDVLGYWGYKTSTKPTSLSSYQRLIAIRKGSVDYHFMKGTTSADYWTHKPGGTNPLTWNYTSPGYKTWTNEYSYYNTSYQGNITYDSSIYYIIYWAKNGPGPQPNRAEQAN